MTQTVPALLVQNEAGVATLTFNRPEVRNAINPEMMVRLADAWTLVREDDDVRAVVLSGAGSAFCGGGDLKTLIPLLTRARPPADQWDERLLEDQRGVVNAAMLRTSQLNKPIIAAVNGACYAGGLEILLGTDIRIAATSARFALSEVQRGLIPAGGSVVRLPRQVPRAVAMEMLLVGDPVSAERAYQVGMLNRLTSEGDELKLAMAVARRIAANGPLAVREIQRVASATTNVPLDEAFGIEDGAARAVMRSQDAREGARAYVERRPPVFTGE